MTSLRGTVRVSSPGAPPVRATAPGGGRVLVSPGVQGPPGHGVNLAGAVPTYADLPTLTVSDAGKAFMVQDDGRLYVWSGVSWPAEGAGPQFRGDKGDRGTGVQTIAVDGSDLSFGLSDGTSRRVTVPALAEASAAAVEAGAAADRAVSARVAAEVARDGAVAAAGRAEGAAGGVAADAVAAGDAAGRAEVSAGAAADSATGAADSAGAAAASATDAEVSATAAAGDATAAVGARDGAVAAADAAAGSAAAAAAAASAAADVRAEVDPLIAVAEGHAAEAGESARQSQASADAARVDADRAEATVTTAAGELRQEVQAHVAAATVAEANAAGSAAAAKNSADAASDSASAAAASAVEAGDVKVLVDTAAEQAAGSAVQAAGYADDARGSATTADAARVSAEVARDEAVQAAESAQTSAPADGWPRASLSADVRDSLTRADTALTSVPLATTSTPGGVQLTGDLGGTWDAPTVPGLAAKMDAQPVSDAATSSTLVKRTSGATIKTARPQADDDAATKKYVDDASASLTATIDQRATTAYVDSAVDADRTRLSALESSRATVAQMQARPAMWLWDGQGTWSPPAGAVATDSVLNLATGEIHSIQEVA